jgi:hypothetical protein
VYCYICGKLSVGSCLKCGKRVCPRHRRRLLGVPLCPRCRPRVRAWGVVTVVAALAAAAVITWLAR